jgi:hypothetical protein
MCLRICVTASLALILPALSHADAPKDPLRFIPRDVQVVAKLERPAALAEAVETHELVREAMKISGVRELYDSTNSRRFTQLLAYFEKELGKDKRELLDLLAGGGAAVAGKFDQKGPRILVVQAKDPQLLERFSRLALDLVEKELVRQELKIPLQKSTYKDIQTFRYGPASIAIVDGALVVTQEETLLKSVIDGQRGKKGKKAKKFEALLDTATVQEARKGIPTDAHAWLWLDLDAVKKQPGFKAGFDAGSQDPNVMILFGGGLDIFRRSPYLTAYLAQEGADWRVRVGMPRGRDGMTAIAKMVLPDGEPGSLPLLQPPRTLASFSYYLDLGSMWKNRKQIFGDKTAEALDKGETEISKALLGAKIGTLLQQMGSHHRVVVAAQGKSAYANKGLTKVPASALVVDMRDPAFGKSVNFFLRGYGLLGVVGTKGSVKLSEQEHAGVKLVCFRFPEDKPFDGDPNGERFNYSPTFGIVDQNVIFSSTTELAKDLIDELKRGTKEPAATATTRSRLYSSGGAEALRAGEQQVLTQLILTQALPPEAAREEVRRIIALVERLGTLNFAIDYGQSDFRFDVLWQRK